MLIQQANNQAAKKRIKDAFASSLSEIYPLQFEC